MNLAKSSYITPYITYNSQVHLWLANVFYISELKMNSASFFYEINEKKRLTK